MRKSIESLARAVLAESGLEARRPVDLRKIAAMEEIRLVEAKFENNLKNVSGALYADGFDVAIFFNMAHAENRQRFTIAHELGHYFLDSAVRSTRSGFFVDGQPMVRWRDANSETGEDPEEIAANAFAAALLMPWDVVLNDVRAFIQLGSDKDLAEALAERYKVSTQAMSLRLQGMKVLGF